VSLTGLGACVLSELAYRGRPQHVAEEDAVEITLQCHVRREQWHQEWWGEEALDGMETTTSVAVVIDRGEMARPGEAEEEGGRVMLVGPEVAQAAE
jgi:hypothetical protein